MDMKLRPTALKLNAAVQDLPAAGEANRTGFPEPLSPHRNTTLRHPSADTSPNASIESSDVPLSRTHSRVSSRHSFGFGHRLKSSRADGPIDMNAFPATVGGRVSVESSIEEVLDGSIDKKSDVNMNGNADSVTNGAAKNGNVVTNGNGALKAMANGATNGAVKGREDGSFENGEMNGDDHKEVTKKKGGMLRKLHLHH